MPANKNELAPQRKRFALTGQTVPIDLRTEAVRGDLADVELADRVFAPHYAKACAFTITVDTELRGTPSADGEVLTVLKAGQRFGLLDVSGGWAWGKCSGAVGYVSSKTIEAV